MKIFIFLAFMALAVGGLVWHLRKSQAKEALARRESLAHRKKQEQEALSQDTEMIWPVIVKPVSGKPASGDEVEVEEPSMTTIEFVPSDEMAAEESSKKAAS